MGYLILFILGVFFGIILMGLCVASSEQSNKKDNHDAGDKKECYCDKEE